MNPHCVPATVLGSTHTAPRSHDPEGGAPHGSAKADALPAHCSKFDPSEFGHTVLEPRG